MATEITRHSGDKPPIRDADWLAREEPLEIRVRGQGIAVTMRTPGHDAELACGFLYSEGLLHQRADVIEVAHCETGDHASLGNILNVFVAPSVQVDFDRLTRHVFASSSCGLCGKATIESVHQNFPPLGNTVQISVEDIESGRAAARPYPNAPQVSPWVIRSLPEKLRAEQAAFEKTGGLHAAALFDLEGNLLVVREDVGRHNAVDKVIGWAFLNENLPLANHILFVSGRASFEIMQKALAARIPIVAAVSAPSSLAVDFARHSGQTLIAFLRGSSFNVYSSVGNHGEIPGENQQMKTNPPQ